MSKILAMIVLVLAFGIPALAQSRMSPDDQAKFNSYYSRWIQAQQKNDRDDVASAEHHMQDLMNRYGIPSDTPYNVVAQQEGPGYGDQDRDRDRGYSQDRNRGYSQDRDRDWDRGNRRGEVGNWQGRLSPNDQRRFDDAYQHWLHERQEGDRKGMSKQESTMQDIMSRYNIPQDTPYDDIASQGQRY